MPDIAFLALSGLVIVSAIFALEARELIYGAVGLAFSLIGVAGLFILLGAEYVAMFQVSVYVGAVVVLILFTIMLVRRESCKRKNRAGLAVRAYLSLAWSLSLWQGPFSYLCRPPCRRQNSTRSHCENSAAS
jgi:NADH-quinone oxidoreductase subunit J